MFSNLNKPAFGTAPASTSFNTFGNAGSSAFGGPTPLFGSTQPTTAPLFGSTTTPAFGATPTQSGFGSGGLFGNTQPQAPGTGLFGGTSATAFGQQNKSASFGFGSSTTGTVFGQAQPNPAQGSTLFQPTASAGMFGASTSFGSTAQSGTVIKFNPVTGTDTMQKSGFAQTINTKHHCITCMKEYENKSLEELRWEDYQANRKGPQQQSSFSAFGATASTAPSLFGQTETKPAFGQATGFGTTTSGFGIASQPSSTAIMFGKPTTAFGTTTTPSTFGFNSAPTANPFGGGMAAKPFTTPSTSQIVFGATSAQPTFGTSVFGQTSTATTGGLFGKPAQPTGFGTTPTGFGAFGQPAATQGTNMFSTTKPNTGFGLFGQTNTTSIGFGQQPQPAFGQTNQNPFNTFAKPASQPLFGQPTQTGFGTGLGAQPFGTAAAKPGGLFSNTGSTGLFSNPTSFPATTAFNLQPQQPQQPQSLTFTTDMQNEEFRNIMRLTSPFGYHEAFAGLKPVKEADADRATNPVTIKALLDSSLNVSTVGAPVEKLKVIPIAYRKLSIFENSKESSEEANFEYARYKGKQLRLRNVISTTGAESDHIREYTIDSEPSISDDTTVPNHSGRQSLFFNNRKDTPQLTRSKGPVFAPTNSDTTSETPETPVGKTVEGSKPKDKSIFTTGGALYPALPKQTNSENDLESLPEELSRDSPLISNTPKGREKVIEKSKRIVSQENEPTFDEAEGDPPVVSSTSNINTCGVVLNRTGYYTMPALEDLPKYAEEDGSCFITGFTIGRLGYGNVYYPDTMDVSNLDLDKIIFFREKEVTVYPNDTEKPAQGEGLNRRAQVTLDRVWPRSKETNEPITDVDQLIEMDFTDVMRRITEKHKARFLEYRPETGSWVFLVNHFSKYGFTASDEEDVADEMEGKRVPTKRNGERKTTEKNGRVDPEDSVRGLGGIPLNQENIHYTRSPSHLTLSADVALRGARQHMYRRDDAAVSLMKSVFFEDGCSISDDMSSSEQQYMMDVVAVSELPMTRALREMHEQPRRVAVVPMETFTIRNVHGIVPGEKSLLTSRVYVDVAMFKGRSFMVGWGKGFNLTAVMTRPSDFAHVAINEVPRGDFSSQRLMCLKITNLSELPNDPFVQSLEQHLRVVRNASDVVIDKHGVPQFKIQKGFDSLLNHQEIAESLATLNPHNEQARYYETIWRLCSVFWGPEEDTPQLFSDWLASIAVPQLNKEVKAYTNALDNIFYLLSGHLIERAAKVAMDEKLPQLAMLVSQLSSCEMPKSLVQDQIEKWKKSTAIQTIGKQLIRLYLLLGGKPVDSEVNICEGLDWKRALALHLWYIAPSSAPLATSLNLYEEAFSLLGYANRPNPPHNGPNKENVYDILYHIMLLYVHIRHTLKDVLNPCTHTDDPLDYRLSWLLLQTFEALNVGTVSESDRNHLHVSFASQLEHLGLWQWAVFVLLYIKDSGAKFNAIIRVLERNLSANLTPETIHIEAMLVNDFKIPPKWIHTVKAEKCEHLGKYWESYGHLALAQDWHKAHEVAMNHILPNLIANSQYEEIQTVLKPLIPVANKILHWDTNAGLLLDFLKLREDLIVNRDSVSDFQLKTIHVELLSLCQRVKAFPTKTPIQTVCISELSKHCAVLLKTLYCELKPTEYSNVSATLKLQELVMPPDYLQDELLRSVAQYCDLQ